MDLSFLNNLENNFLEDFLVSATSDLVDYSVFFLDDVVLVLTQTSISLKSLTSDK